MKAKFVLIGIIVLTFCSCSSYSFKVGSASLIGAMGGYAISKKTSPNEESMAVNNAIGIGSGLLLGGLVGHSFFKYSDPTQEVRPLFQKENLDGPKDLNNFNAESHSALIKSTKPKKRGKF